MEGNELDESDNSNLSAFANSSADDDHNNSSKYDSSSSKDQGGLVSTAINERIRRWEELESQSQVIKKISFTNADFGEQPN